MNLALDLDLDLDLDPTLDLDLDLDQTLDLALDPYSFIKDLSKKFYSKKVMVASIHVRKY